jgi:hypothetical protein
MSGDFLRKLNQFTFADFAVTAAVAVDLAAFSV